MIVVVFEKSRRAATAIVVVMMVVIEVGRLAVTVAELVVIRIRVTTMVVTKKNILVKNKS